MTPVSIVIPVFNEGGIIEAQLQSLQPFMDKGFEVIVVDGGSDDDTVNLSRPLATHVIQSKQKGRAAQMNAGAAIAQGRVLVFLHSDTQLPESALAFLPEVDEEQWGFFQLKLSGKLIMLRVVETMINLRSRFTSVATGDQSLFIGKKLFTENKGFALLPLMEDVEFSKRLRQQVKPVVFKTPVITSSRRWEEKGVWKTIFLMWRLRLLYFLGVSPEKLLKQYY